MTAFEATWDVYELYVLHKAYAGWLPGHLQLLRPWLCRLCSLHICSCLVLGYAVCSPMLVGFLGICSCLGRGYAVCWHMSYRALWSMQKGEPSQLALAA